VIGAVEVRASRLEAAERSDLSPSAVIKWVRRYHENWKLHETEIAAAKPCGGSTSPLEKHKDWLLALVAEQSQI
jgi:transposase